MVAIKYEDNDLVKEYLNRYYTKGKPNNMIKRFFKGFNNFDIDDLLQETFIRLLKNLERIKEKDIELSRAVSTITFSVTKDFIKKRISRDKKYINENELLLNNGSYDEHAQLHSNLGPLNKMEIEDSKCDLVNKVRKLPEDLRELMVSRWFNEMPYNNIACYFDIPIGTVKSKLHYGLKLLKEEYELEKLLEVA